jgi:hypothetical protein
MTVPMRWACFLTAVLLNACGGGDASDVRLPDANASKVVGPAVTVTAPTLSGGQAFATGGVEAVFEGGVCDGGNGQFSASWMYGDTSSSTTPNRHTYPVSGIPMVYGLTVQCTDTANNPPAAITALINVRP